jgi:quercetin dioxygenase-like cupin family protein
VKVTRIADAKPYTAPKHFDVSALRLQGFEASASKNFWVGLSHYLPGGRAERDATPIEKVYVVLSGEITVITDGGEQRLGPLDSCHLDPNEARAVQNRTKLPASMLVIMPYPPKG